MDGLPPIRILSLTQQRVREALKNAPPLTITKKTNDNFVVFDDENKNEISLFDRFLKHKTITSKNLENESKKRGVKWFELKDKMIEELEIKRMESQKFKDINEKLENEEIDEEVEDEFTTILDEKNDNQNNSEFKQNNSDEEQQQVEDDEDIEDEEVSDSEEEEEEEVGDSDEDEESERESNPFVDDEAEDDEDLKDVDQKLETHSDDSRESFEFNCHQKELSFVEKDCNEDNGLETSFSQLDESFDRKCATQKIALSPFITQKPKPRFDSNHNFSELISDFKLNDEEFNSQSLLDLCSGNFAENDRPISSQIKESQTDLKDDEDSHHNSDSEEDDDKEVLSCSKKVAKVFNIESDYESEADDKNSDLKTNEEVKTSIRNFNGSDGEELIVTDEEEAEDGHEEEEEHNVNSFFDNEAELSGSEASSDEDDAEDEEQEEEDAEQEDLPSDSEIEDQNKRYFNKQILDEEKRNIMIWKERLFEDGDLHDGGRQRQKKFRWNFDTNEDFVNDYINEDSDDNYMDSDEDEKTKTPTLKMTDQTIAVETKVTQTLDKLKSNFKQSFNLKNINKTIGSSETKSSSISAFVVRDKRLTSIMSVKNKRSLNSKNNSKSNKRLKSSKKNTKTSIFDLLNPNN